MLPILHELKRKFGPKLNIGITDVDSCAHLGEAVALPHVPLYIVCAKGEEYFRVGPSPQQLQLALERLIEANQYS